MHLSQVTHPIAISTVRYPSQVTHPIVISLYQARSSICRQVKEHVGSASNLDGEKIREQLHRMSSYFNAAVDGSNIYIQLNGNKILCLHSSKISHLPSCPNMHTLSSVIYHHNLSPTIMSKHTLSSVIYHQQPTH